MTDGIFSVSYLLGFINLLVNALAFAGILATMVPVCLLAGPTRVLEVQ